MCQHLKSSKCESLKRVWLFEDLWTVARQAPLSTEFSQQEYWSGLPFPSPGDLSKPGIKLRSPALQADSLPSEPPPKKSPKKYYVFLQNYFLVLYLPQKGYVSDFFIVQLSHPYMTTGKTIDLTRWTFVGKVMSLLLNMLSRLVLTFLPRSVF